MDQQRVEQEHDSGTPHLLSLMSTWAGNFQRNTTSAFANMGLKGYIRLVVIIGAYCLLRPYLIKLAARAQAKDLERRQAVDESSADPSAKTYKLGGSSSVELPDLDSENDDEPDTMAASWGKNARRRQRTMIKEKLAEHERRLAEEATESDKEIEQFLIDD